LLRQQASADKEPIPTEVDGGSEAEMQYRIQRVVERVQNGARPPKPKEVGDFYKKNREQFRTPDLMHAAHIVKNVNEQQDEEAAQAAIEKALEELRAGADFSEVADRHSDCAGNGGDLGWFPRGEMVDEFDNVAFSMETGATSGIFRSEFGFHIVKVLERKPAGIRPFAEVKDQIEQALLQQKREKALEDHLDRLRAAAEIRQDNGKAAG
jgi:parvulin-like peptidyl-prolyl isomerase